MTIISFKIKQLQILLVIFFKVVASISLLFLSFCRCDECHLHYHFLCLDPPVKKSPKNPGFNWTCAQCYPVDLVSLNDFTK